jgi:Sulfotransferase domain
MKLPNFFIVGAPKCGTTAISEYLRTHPRVFMCHPKEPHYFAIDIPGYRRVRDWEAYRSLFRRADGNCLASGEASVFYLYSEAAIEEIRKTLPDARLLIMLRNPLELAVSMHAQALLSRDENVDDFVRAWDMCQERRNGRGVPRRCRDRKILLYDQLPLLGHQLQRLLTTFPATQVRWWFFEDFAADPGEVYREILSFLSVPDDGRREFDAINSRRRARSQLLAQFSQKPPRALSRSAMRLKEALGISRWGVMDAVRKVNFVPAQRTELSAGLRDRMKEHFAPDIGLLESVTGRDLGHWLEDAA